MRAVSRTASGQNHRSLVRVPGGFRLCREGGPFRRCMIERVPPQELHQDLRTGVRALCKDFPDTYWRELDAQRGYPDGVREGADRRRISGGADSGRIRRSWSRHHRGGSHPRGNQPMRCERRGVPRADVHHGHAAAPRQRRAEARVSSGDRRRRAPAAGVRRDRADDRLRYDTAQDHGGREGDRTSSTARRSGSRGPNIPT